MLTFKNFSGINNVLHTSRLGESDLAVALNVDFGLTGEASRRSGYMRIDADAHTNLFQTAGFSLATIGINGDLTSLDSGAVLYPSLGHNRIWYVALPDGRVAFSNELIAGVSNGAQTTKLGVPIPTSVGALTEIAGDLYPGEYQWQITYSRQADGKEGGPAYSQPEKVSTGGIFLSGLPVAPGYRINVYLTSHNGGPAFYAGSTENGLFSFIGNNSALVQPCRTDFMEPAPAGRCLTSWRGRVLVAKGSVLYASRPNGWEDFDIRRDFKQFEAAITAVVPVDDGLYVGTETELAFLSGSTWDTLSYRRVLDGRVVLGSGLPVSGDLIKQGDGVGSGNAMMCIAGGGLVAGFNGGGVIRMTEGRYHTDAVEVFSAFRVVNGVPQYVGVMR